MLSGLGGRPGPESDFSNEEGAFQWSSGSQWCSPEADTQEEVLHPCLGEGQDYGA